MEEIVFEEVWMARSLTSKDKKEKGEISFKRGESLAILRKRGHDYYGEKSGKSGWFPKYYVRPAPDIPLDPKYVKSDKKKAKRSRFTTRFGQNDVKGGGSDKPDTPAPVVWKKEISVFGNTLAQLMENQKNVHPYLNVPLFIRRATTHIVLHGLGEEGPFRLPGSSTVMRQMKEELNAGKDVLFGGKGEDVYNACDLLKRFCKELAEPVIPQSCEPAFVKTIVPDDQQMIQLIREAITTLPPVNYSTLQEVMTILHLVTINGNVNKMAPMALALMWTGNLFRANEYYALPGLPGGGPAGIAPSISSPPGGGGLSNAVSEMESLNKQGNLQAVVIKMIENYVELFGEQEFLLDQPTQKWVSFSSKLVGHRRGILTICRSENGERIWTGELFGYIRIWRALPGSFVKQFRAVEDSVNCIISIKESFWVGTSVGLNVYNSEGELQRNVPDIEVSSLISVGDGTIWVASHEYLMRIKEANFENLFNEPLSGENILFMIIHQDNLWTGTDKGKIIIRTKDGKQIQELTTHSGQIVGLISVGDNVWSADEHTIIVWNSKFKQIHKHTRTDKLSSISIVGQNVWAYSDPLVFIYDQSSAECVGDFTHYHTAPITGGVSVWDNNKQRFQAWTASQDKSVCIWNVKESDDTSSLSLSTNRTEDQVEDQSIDEKTTDTSSLDPGDEDSIDNSSAGGHREKKEKRTFKRKNRITKITDAPQSNSSPALTTASTTSSSSSIEKNGNQVDGQSSDSGSSSGGSGLITNSLSVPGNSLQVIMWTNAEVIKWVEANGEKWKFSSKDIKLVKEAFKTNKVNGKVLLKQDQETLRDEIGIESSRIRGNLSKAIIKLKTSKRSSGTGGTIRPVRAYKEGSTGKKEKKEEK